MSVNITKFKYTYCPLGFKQGHDMSLHWKEWNRNDLVYGIAIPIIVVLLIVGFSFLSSALRGSFGGIVTGITMEIEELLIIVAIPLLLGLVWNRWAGGASGFLLGTLYALYWADSYHSIRGGGLILLAYILSGMLIGYMAGALNRGSSDFIRMLISGTVAATIGGIVLFGVFQLSSVNVVTGTTGLLISVLGRTACAVIIAVLAKVFVWYGLKAHYDHGGSAHS
jgi:hypothetical protein